MKWNALHFTLCTRFDENVMVVVMMMMKSYVALSNLQHVLRGKIEEGYYFKPKQTFDLDESGRIGEEA